MKRDVRDTTQLQCTDLIWIQILRTEENSVWKVHSKPLPESRADFNMASSSLRPRPWHNPASYEFLFRRVQSCPNI